MTSNINPNNINGAYPVAGQDNNSQGFRDNFTNTSTNFQYAANEITDLQNKVILSAQLTGGNALTAQNNMQNAPLINALISDFAIKAALLNTQSGSVVLNYTTGHYQAFTTGGSVSLGFTNWPIAGQAGILTVQINVTDPTYTVTFPAAVTVNRNGIQGLNTSTNVMSFAATGVYSFTFITTDNGTTITINENNKELQPFNASVDAVASAGACSLATATSTFSTGGTATLAAGVSGQVKTLVQTQAASMVVTVASAGWGGASHLTLTGAGETATLQFISGAWYKIAGAGVTS